MSRSRTAVIVTTAAVTIVLVAAAAVVTYLLSGGTSCPNPAEHGAGTPVSGPYTTPSDYWTRQRMQDVHGHENRQGPATGCGPR